MDGSFWKGRRVAVTGHTGFKGAWLSYWLTKKGAAVCGIALAPVASPNLYDAADLGDMLESHFQDIRDADGVRARLGSFSPEIVFHLAGQALVLASYQRPVETYAVNALGTAHVLEAVRACESVSAVVCVTTDKCYENREWIWPYRESDRLGGRDPYSSSKACAELIVSAYAASFLSGSGVGVASARGGNVIGGGDWADGRIIPDLVRAFADGRPAIVRNPDAVRPWQSVLDALDGYVALAEHLARDSESFSEPWNFAPDPGAELRVRDVADLAAHAWGAGAHWEHRSETGAPHESLTLRLDNSKAHARLGWRPLLPVEETINRAARWYRRHHQGGEVRSLMDSEIEDFEERSAVPA
jgi:CDP-glucose 4,6-dehydratase